MADCKPEVYYIFGAERDVKQIPTASPTLSTIPDLLVTPLTQSDVGRSPKFKMADCQPEAYYIFGTERDIREIPTANPTFSTIPDLLVSRGWSKMYG